MEILPDHVHLLLQVDPEYGSHCGRSESIALRNIIGHNSIRIGGVRNGKIIKYIRPR